MMFDASSRYANATPYLVQDRRGRMVQVVPVASAPDDAELGIHSLKQGERLDLLAQKYLNNPTGFWRICEQNDVMLAEALTEQLQISVPAQKL